MIASIMDDFNAKRSLEELTKLTEPLREENAALRQENATLRQERVELAEQLTAAQAAQAQAEAELSTLTDAAQVLQDDREALQHKNSELQAAVDRLSDMLWGRRSEKRIYRDQPTLFDLQPTPDELSAREQEIVAAEDLLSDAAKKKLLEELLRRRKARQKNRLKERGREDFPEHLERRQVDLDLDEEDKQDLDLLDVKVFERLRFERPHMYVEVVNRYIYVRRGEPDAGVFAAPPPLGILPGVKYDFSVIAAALSMKLNFHQPTYRQQDIFAQAGYFPSRSTLNDLFNYSAIVIEPLFNEAWRLLLQQNILLGDDTRVRLLTRGALEDEEIEKLKHRRGAASRERPPPGSVSSYVWLYTGLDGAAPYDIFHWSLTHENCWIDSHLERFHGIFVGDAAGPNARLEQRSGGRIIHAACNSHARREFLAAEKTHPREAAKALAFYKLLYDVETRSQLMKGVDLLEVRRKEAIPIWNAFIDWMESDALQAILPKSPLGKAITYMQNHGVALRRYLYDARLPIDNNVSERTLRHQAVGRKNWIFIGAPQAGPRAAVLYTILASAKGHHVEPWACLKDLLLRLHADDPKLDEMLPDRWIATHPQAKLDYRLAEIRRKAAAAKQCRSKRRAKKCK